MLLDRSESKANFSVAQAIIDISKNISRPDLTPAFYAELIYLFSGLEGRGPGSEVADIHLFPISNKGREAAIQRSDQLDLLSEAVNLRMDRYVSGLEPAAVERREKRRHTIINYFQASPSDWNNWQWQIDNIFRDPDKIADLTTLSNNEKEAIDAAKTAGIPFGVTPHYLSLMDDEPNSGRDLSIRAQVFPTTHYVETLTDPLQKENCFDFMKEEDTSPIDLITRRYPAICIFKPFNTCPQICVYCQRNWEIEDAMAPDALASEKQLNTALEWIKSHPSIYEVLITGGDPLAMADKDIDRILHGVSQIPTVERIRIGTRVPVTVPMRINNDLTDIIKKYQIPGKRQIAVVTHIQHAYEITPDTLKAINKIREKGISVYNQLVFTFYNSRRFEAAHLRKVLTMIGVDPYYTFNTKGKEETNEYRLPLARLLQEQKEEARLLPGISRTDEAVYNVPSLGKNYLRARQHRDLISILPDGSRLYEFHPWEKNISNFAKTYIGQDIPILEYLKRLDEMGENVAEYETIWYYY
jgi:lysine 2,3-aminomutase